MLDLRPAARALADVVVDVRDDQLGGSTPCVGSSVGDLIDHVDGLSLAFTAAARKVTPEGGSQPPPPADVARLGPDWRTRVPERLVALADAWQDPAAWTGMTRAGGIELPGEVAGLVALDEVVVHGWDIAIATGQVLARDDASVEAVHQLLEQAVAEHPEGTPGMFGAPVDVPPEATLFDRVIGLTGRDPAWAGSSGA